MILQLKLFSNRNSGCFYHGFLVIPILSALLLAGCDNSTKQEAAPPAAKVTVIMAEAQDTPIVVEFVGKTASSRRV